MPKLPLHLEQIMDSIVTWGEGGGGKGGRRDRGGEMDKHTHSFRRSSAIKRQSSKGSRTDRRSTHKGQTSMTRTENDKARGRGKGGGRESGKMSRKAGLMEGRGEAQEPVE